MQRTLTQNNHTQNTSFQRSSPLKNPSLKSGYCLLFDHKAPIEMNYVDYQRNTKHLGSNEMINFKIYTQGYKPNISRVKIEIDSDGDPFFSGVYETDENMFEMVRENQKLSFDFQDFPTVLIKSLNKIEQAKGKMSATLLVYSDGKCNFTIWHCLEYKNVQVISLDFGQQNEDDVSEKVAVKYGLLRDKLIKTEQRLAKINQIIRQKNPSLLMQLTKTTQRNFRDSKALKDIETN